MILKKAFTLAEVLTTLTVIGIVAAIVVPSLIANVNEKAFDTQRKALYARFSQAIPLLPKIAGYGTLSKDTNNNITDTAAETFITEGLSKVMKMNNVCYSDNLADCNFPETFSDIAGNSISLSTISTLGTLNNKMVSSGSYKINNLEYTALDTKAAAFETANGESVLVYYNPNCQPDLKETTVHFTQPKMCANFVYDLNGAKAPNTVGKDIGFITVLYPTNSVVVAPMPLATNTSSVGQTAASAKCKEQDAESRLPNRDELSSVFYNMKLLGTITGLFWTSSVITAGSSGTAWTQSFDNGDRNVYTKNYSLNVRCVKK